MTIIHQYGQVYTFNQQSTQRDLFLYYASSHYESLRVPNELVLSIRAKALAGKPQGGRCGGKTTAKSSQSDHAVSVIGGLTASSGKSVRSLHKPRSSFAASSSSLGGRTGSKFSDCGKVQTAKPKARASGSKATPGRIAGSLGGLTRRSFIKQPGQNKSQAAASQVSSIATKETKPVAAKPSLGGLTRKSFVLKRTKQGDKQQASSQARSRTSQGSVTGSLSARTKGTSKAHSKPLVKSFAAGIALKGNRRDPKDVWTCPHKGCGVTFCKGETQRSLSDLRAAHLTKCHPDIPRSKNDHMREYAPPVLASASIPEGERDWSCPWCAAGLPLLSKSDKSKAVTHHYATKHPKRDTSAGKSNSVRAALARKGSAKAANYFTSCDPHHDIYTFSY